MVATLDWADIDPLTGGGQAVAGGQPAISRGAIRGAPNASTSTSSGLPFFAPDHELFAFGVLVALTAGALYVATEGMGAGLRAHVGKARAGADIDLGGDT